MNTVSILYVSNETNVTHGNFALAVIGVHKKGSQLL